MEAFEIFITALQHVFKEKKGVEILRYEIVYLVSIYLKTGYTTMEKRRSFHCAISGLRESAMLTYIFLHHHHCTSKVYRELALAKQLFSLTCFIYQPQFCTIVMLFRIINNDNSAC